MKKEIEVLKLKLKIIEHLNKKYKGKFKKNVKEIEKEIEELKKADKEIWEETE